MLPIAVASPGPATTGIPVYFAVNSFKYFAFEPPPMIFNLSYLTPVIFWISSNFSASVEVSNLVPLKMFVFGVFFCAETTSLFSVYSII